MNEQRAFTVVVTGCKNCTHVDPLEQLCNFPDSATIGEAHIAYKQNKDAITPTCPMWNEAKPIGELKCLD